MEPMARDECPLWAAARSADKLILLKKLDAQFG